jgi:tripartite-type tricarboxylate transporter receptor subunit TctC
MNRTNSAIVSRRMFVAFALTVVSASLAISLAACSTAAPAPTAPTPAAAAATSSAAPKTSAPTAAPAAAAPTAVPAKKVDWPAKGKSITLIVPFAAGGPVDLTSRLLAPLMEKELGVPVQVVNKAGASTQTGMAEMVKSKPDGYTIEMPSIPTTLVTYLDAERKAPYGRKDFELVASAASDASTLSTKADGPYKTLKDLVDAAKAKPEGIKLGTAGIGGVTHLAGVALEEEAGVKFGFVHFDGGAPSTTAALAGHTDASLSSAGAVRAMSLSGQLRVLAVFDKEESPLLPGVKTAESQGYKVQGVIINGIVVPAGTPKEIKDTMEAAIKKATADQEFGKKLNEVGLVARFMDQAQYSSYWTGNEDWTKRYMDKAK